jgi:hypothetical protein
MTWGFADARYRLAGVLIAAVQLWLMAAQPVFAIGPAGHDDRLYLILAEQLLHGQWLGPYNQMTLAKGPAYPLFVATTLWMGIPLPLAQHLLYLGAAWLMMRAVRPLLRSDGWALVLLAALLWQPMAYELPVLGRVLRQGLYTPCTLVVFASLAALYTRAAASWVLQTGWSLLLGISLAALWLTREETVWIVPAVAWLAAAAGVGLWRNHARPHHIGIVLAAGLASAALPVLLVCTLNARNYGWFGTVEYRAPEFIAAYSALSRVRTVDAGPFIPTPRASRQEAYRVSPAFAELRPFLEGEIGKGWARASANWIPGHAPEEIEIGGGWWMWALRDAVSASGNAKSAGQALAYYQQVADEVNAACDRREIRSGPMRHSFMPEWRSEFTDALARHLPRFFIKFMLFGDFSARPPPSWGNAEALLLFRDLSQWHLSPSKDAPELTTQNSNRVRSWRIEALHGIGTALRFVFGTAIAMAAAAFLVLGLRSWRRRSAPGYLWWLGAAALGGCICVVVLNLLVHITSFPNESPGAFAQAYPLAVVFTITTFAALVSALPLPCLATLHRALGRRGRGVQEPAPRLD